MEENIKEQENKVLETPVPEKKSTMYLELCLR